ncbi:hypothetical protein BH10ACI1_BH10ACI1_31900 [soil metagenome]
MKHKLQFIVAMFALLVFSNSVFAGYNTIDINTGLDQTNDPATLYTIGQKDDFWRLISPSSQSTDVIASVVGWATAQPNSQWISPGAVSGTFYVYERCFCLNNPEKALIMLSLRADNRANLFLNDYSQNILQTTKDYSFAPSRKPAETKTDKGFVKGKNCIRVIVQNDGGATGFNLVGTVSGNGAQQIANQCCRETQKLFTSKQPTALVNAP